MLPMYLLTNTPSTSTGNNTKLDPHNVTLKASAPVRAGTIGDGTIRCVLPLPMVSSTPMRVKVRSTVSGFEDGRLYKPRERMFALQTITVAARKKRNPMLTGFAQHTPSRNHETTYQESSQFNPAQLDTLSLGTHRNSQIHNSQSNLSTNGTMLIHDQQYPGMHSGYPLSPFDAVATVPGSVWYPMSPPPMPVYFCAPPQIDPQALHQAMKQASKAEKLYQTKQQKPVSPCQQFCCGGFARVLWLIIFIVLIGCIGIIVVSIAHI